MQKTGAKMLKNAMKQMPKMGTVKASSMPSKSFKKPMVPRKRQTSIPAKAKQSMPLKAKKLIPAKKSMPLKAKKLVPAKKPYSPGSIKRGYTKYA